MLRVDRWVTRLTISRWATSKKSSASITISMLLPISGPWYQLFPLISFQIIPSFFFNFHQTCYMTLASEIRMEILVNLALQNHCDNLIFTLAKWLNIHCLVWKDLFSFKVHNEPDVRAYVYNPSSQKSEAKGSVLTSGQASHHPQMPLHNKFLKQMCSDNCSIFIFPDKIFTV